MLDQNTFMETIQEVKEMIATAETPMTETQILEYFSDMDLSMNQKTTVLDYLMNPENYQEQPKQEEENKEQLEESVDRIFDNSQDKTNTYQMYLEELGDLPVYTEEQLDELYGQLLKGEDSAIETISMAWLMRITDLAAQYMEPKLALEDMVQEGNMALFMELQAICGLNENIDVDSRLNEAIEKSIMAFCSEMRDARESEESVVGKVNLVNLATQILTEENGSVPTIKELAEYTKMSEETLQGLQELIDEARKRQED